MVGHSWGGAVITEAGNHPKVKGLVYVAAGAPDSGQSFDDWWKPYSPAPGASEIKRSHVPMLSQPAAVAEFIAKAVASL
jgi:pimeloyl-ACP methyl ester carboxylesterase